MVFIPLSVLFCRTVVRPKRIGWSHPNEALSHLLSSAGYNHPWTLMYLACYPCLDTDMKTEICQAVLNRLLCLAHLRYCCSTFLGQEMNVVFTWSLSSYYLSKDPTFCGLHEHKAYDSTSTAIRSCVSSTGTCQTLQNLRSASNSDMEHSLPHVPLHPFTGKLISASPYSGQLKLKSYWGLCDCSHEIRVEEGILSLMRAAIFALLSVAIFLLNHSSSLLWARWKLVYMYFHVWWYSWLVNCR